MGVKIVERGDDVVDFPKLNTGDICKVASGNYHGELGVKIDGSFFVFFGRCFIPNRDVESSTFRVLPKGTLIEIT